MIKKLLTVLGICMVMLTGSVSAKMGCASALQSPKSGLGASIFYTKHATDDFGLLLTYNSTFFVAAFGGNHEHVKFSSSDRTTSWFEYMYYGGIRYPMQRKLFVGGGVTGSLTDSNAHPYSLGAYVGLDYYLMRQVAISFKISPYLYEKRPNKDKFSSAFAYGSIELNYTF